MGGRKVLRRTRANKSLRDNERENEINESVEDCGDSNFRGGEEAERFKKEGASMPSYIAKS